MRRTPVCAHSHVLPPREAGWSGHSVLLLLRWDVYVAPWEGHPMEAVGARVYGGSEGASRARHGQPLG